MYPEEVFIYDEIFDEEDDILYRTIEIWLEADARSRLIG